MTQDGPEFLGTVGRSFRDSAAWWPEPARAPDGAPNVVFIVLDDVGFAHLGCYGSDIATPTMDRLAAGGLRYTNFHTTAMCSPTRACLLTGRNHHAAGVGTVAENATGFPGYRNYLSKRAGTLADMLGPRGYSTLAVGKWHLMPLRDTTAAGPFDYWPTSRGFDHWYGFPGGYTDQWHPELYEDTHAVETPDRPDYHLSEDLVDRAIGYVRDQQSAAPDRPFFLYVAFGAAHWPHQVPKAYVETYRGRFDRGWDVAREEWLARQIELGIVPPGTPLAPRDPDVPAWSTLTPDEQRLAARHMEVYAGFLEHADTQIGRLVDYLAEIGQLDNTLLVLISDNGASDEGGRVGCHNVYKQYSAGIEEPLSLALDTLDQLGGETSNPHYPRGWAQAGNTPLKWYKKNTYGGGVRDPLIVHWPARIADGGGLRRQYHHVTDIVPTVLELLDMAAPSVVKGVPQMPVHGTSLAYTFEDPATPTRKRTQYYEMLGDRGIWHDGWKAVVKHQKGVDFEQDRWELYHLAEDYAEAHDLAEERPEKLREMVERWWAEAGRYDVLPLDDRSTGARMAASGWKNPRRVFTYLPGMARIERWNTPNVTNRSYTISAEVEIPGAADGAGDAARNGSGEATPVEGVLLAAGGRFGGYVLFAQDGHLIHEYNFGDVRYVIRSDRPIPAGRHRLRFTFEKTGQFQGRGTLSIDGETVGTGELPRTWPINPSTAALTCGRDENSPVSEAYRPPFTFTGRIERVTLELGDDQQRDPAAEQRAALAAD
ncbi:MAG: sulfatase-like hydrolase/transferase [Chloroflexi bacterium]|nr:sulfatase-like hydrolase/transferase [Chloroflexota bacterium]